jgi:hypothetical protein
MNNPVEDNTGDQDTELYRLSLDRLEGELDVCLSSARHHMAYLEEHGLNYDDLMNDPRPVPHHVFVSIRAVYNSMLEAEKIIKIRRSRMN